MTRLKVSKETEKYLKEVGSNLLYDMFHFLNGKGLFKASQEAFKELENSGKEFIPLVHDILTGKITVYSSDKFVLLRNIITEEWGDCDEIAPLYWSEKMFTLEYDRAQVLDEEEDKLLISVLIAQGWTKKEVYNY